MISTLWTIDGLPLHPLLVHAPVVLIPLCAVGLGLFLVWPSARPVLGLTVLALAVGAALTSILAVETGEQLVEALGRGATADRHANRGVWVRNMAVGTAIATALVVAVDRSSAAEVRRWSHPLAAATAMAALFATVMVGLAGHSGAQLAWEGRVPMPDDAAQPVPGGDTEPSPAADGAADGPSASDPFSADPSDDVSDRGPEPTIGNDGADPAADASDDPPSELLDDAVDVVLGEWAVILDVDEVPPGPVIFRIRNAGEVVHSLRIRTPGSGSDRLEWRSPEIAPGMTTTWTVDLPVGTFELTCPIEGVHGEHDELGMRSTLTVREGAPTPGARAEPTNDPAVADPNEDAADPTSTGEEAIVPSTDSAGDAGDATGGATTADPVSIDISAFEFATPVLRIPVGTEVTWVNRDPAPHTATGSDFDTGILQQNESASVVFDTPGTYEYICELHPSMTATVIVG